MIVIQKGVLALGDGRFVLVAEDAGCQIVGAGRVERQGSRLGLIAERWMTAREGRARYQRQVRIDAVLAGGELRIPREALLRVRSGTSRGGARSRPWEEA